MATYKIVTLDTDISKIKRDVDQARKEETYDGLYENFDREILSAIELGLSNAKSNTSLHMKALDSIRTQCKKQLDWMEETVKGKKAPTVIDEKTISAMESCVTHVKKLNNDLHQLNREFKTAMQNFRGEWYQYSKKSLSNEKLSAPFDGDRRNLIDGDNAAALITGRCDEYAARVGPLFKQAMLRHNKEKLDKNEFAEEADEHVELITKAKENIFTTFPKKAIEVLKIIAKKNEKDLKEDDRKEVASRLIVVARAAKEARGSLKTIQTLNDSLELRAKAISGTGWKDKGLNAVKQAKKVYAEAKELATTLNTEEKAAQTLLGDIEKALEEQKKKKK